MPPSQNFFYGDNMKISHLGRRITMGIIAVVLIAV